MTARMVNAIPTANANLAGFAATSPLLVPDRCRLTLEGDRERFVSYLTLRCLSKKCMGAQGVQKIMGYSRILVPLRTGR